MRKDGWLKTRTSEADWLCPACAMKRKAAQTRAAQRARFANAQKTC